MWIMAEWRVFITFGSDNASRRKGISWNSVDWLSVKSRGIHLRTIKHEILKTSVTKVSFGIYIFYIRTSQGISTFKELFTKSKGLIY